MCTLKEGASSAGLLRWRTYNSSNSPPVETTSSYSLLLLVDCCCVLYSSMPGPQTDRATSLEQKFCAIKAVGDHQQP